MGYESASGGNRESYTLEDFVTEAFRCLGLDGQEYTVKASGNIKKI